MGLLSLLLIALTACRAAVAEDDVIHLTLWHGVNPPPNRDVLQSLVQRFNDTHADIQVEALYVGQAEQQIPKILAAVVGSVPPDLLWYSPLLTGRLVELDAIRPLDDWWETVPVARDIDPALEKSMRWEDHLWSVPFGTNNVGLFYRPSLFEQTGVEVPKTWETLRQAAQALTTGDRHGLLLPLGNGEWTVFMWLPFLWSSGGDVLNAKGVSLVSPEAIAALQYWQDLIADGSAALSAPERGFELDGFLSGKVAMQLTGPWTLAQLNATGVDFDVMPIPQNQQPATSTGGENLFVFKSTPERERAALTVAEFMVSETTQTEWAIKTGYLPVNLRSRQSEPYRQYVAKNPAVQVFLDQAKVGRSRPLLPGYSRLSESLGRAIEAVLLQTATPEEAIAAAQRRFQNSQP
jgi:multiple sugar transport system substrate-binding protein